MWQEMITVWKPWSFWNEKRHLYFFKYIFVWKVQNEWNKIFEWTSKWEMLSGHFLLFSPFWSFLLPNNLIDFFFFKSFLIK